MTRYDLVYYLIAPLALPYFGYRAWRRGKYHESARGMFGRDLPEGEERAPFRNGSIWVHAVSVGETVAARSIVPELCAIRPELPLLATTITETGQAHARKILAEHARHVHYFPVDLSWNVQRFLDAFNPRVFVMMETELWPNFLTLAAHRGTQVFMANGKLSEKSFRGYRHGRAGLRPAFDAIRAFCMQTEADAERMRELCARPHDVHVTGNCKFDAPAATLSDSEAAELRRRYGLGEERRPVIVVGSTHPTEEEAALAAFAEVRRRIPRAQMILSPRHPERFNEAAALCRNVDASWRVARVSEGTPSEPPDILVLDTMGELARAYGLGDVAVVAGSFTPLVGGHNLLEAAAHAVPVVVGPHMHAQKEIDRLFQPADSGCVRTDRAGLGACLSGLLNDDARRREVGRQALATAERNRGSAHATVAVIRQYLEGKRSVVR